jgi:hypothetical protein
MKPRTPMSYIFAPVLGTATMLVSSIAIASKNGRVIPIILSISILLFIGFLVQQWISRTTD